MYPVKSFRIMVNMLYVYRPTVNLLRYKRQMPCRRLLKINAEVSQVFSFPNLISLLQAD